MVLKKKLLIIYTVQIFYLFCNSEVQKNFNKTPTRDTWRNGGVSENAPNIDEKIANRIIEENKSYLEEEVTESYDGVNQVPSESSTNVFSDWDFSYIDFDEIKPDIENLSIFRTSSTSVTVRWDVKDENITKFLIEWYSNGELSGNLTENIPGFSECSRNRTVSVYSLEPCTEYNIKVTPWLTDEDMGIGKDVNGTTNTIQPNAPSIIAVDPLTIHLAAALNITWQTPTVGASCIKIYVVSVDVVDGILQHHVKLDTNKSNIMIQNLYACTSYNVTVKAIDLDGGEGLATVIQSKPTPKLPFSRPRLTNRIHVPPFVTTNSSITLNWYVQDCKNNCSITTVNSVCSAAYTEGYGFELKWRAYNMYYVEAGSKPEMVPIVMKDLSPYTAYFCSGWLQNKSGLSRRSVPVTVYTKEAAPSPPQNFRRLDDSRSKVIFQWLPPAIMPGKLQRYRIRLSSNALYPVPDFCPMSREHVLDNIHQHANNPISNYTWDKGEAFMEYTATIEARTGGGWSDGSPPITFRSPFVQAPDAVTNLKYKTKPLKSDSNTLETRLSWNLPCSLRGRLMKFIVSAIGTRANKKNDSISAVVIVDSNFQKNDVFHINLGELQPQYNYSFEVSAVIRETYAKGEVAKYMVEYPAGIPPQPNQDYVESITLNHNQIKRTPTTFEILLPLFPDTNGDIQYYSIIVSRMNSNYQQTRARLDMKTAAWPNISSWRESMEKDFMLPYQATEPYWDPDPNNILDYGSIKAVKIVVGDDVTCKDVSLGTDSRLYCNGPLQPDTWYEVRMRAFTNGGYADSSPFTVKTDAGLSVVLIISIVIGILLLGVVVAIFLSRKSYVESKKNAAEQEHEQEPKEHYQNNRRLTLNAHEISVMRTRRRSINHT